MAAAFLFSPINTFAEGDIPQVLFENYQACKPIPLPSASVPNLDVKKAYQIQDQFVSKLIQKGDKVAGYKAGLTSAPAQKKFKAPGPVTGVLLESMQIVNGKIPAKNFTKMMLEVEIGYILKEDISKPIKPEEAKDLITTILPAIEVPDLNFATFKGLKFTDIIADNVGARGFILGQGQAAAKVDPNQVTGQLFLNGQALGDSVPGRAALGDQWKALAWTINNILAQGGHIKKGMVVITGSLGRMYPGKPGSYKAVYTGGLEEIAFMIQ